MYKNSGIFPRFTDKNCNFVGRYNEICPMKHAFCFLSLMCALCLVPSRMKSEEVKVPRVVNIINFIRGVEPRDNGIITPEILYTTVENQAKCLRANDLTGTYLLMYNALVMPNYQHLLKEELARGCEVGGWWEISQPQCEAAGVKWRADVPWLHHANVGFSMGYTTYERELLVDAYMEKFKEVFGHYPASIGSWFIDAHTLAYIYDKYGLKASCDCRDQVGTDGYTLWGGYWTGGFYPSRQNAYMPAQTSKGQIDVPVFRMLGSDPIYQYDAGLGINAWQSVRTLEPTCTDGGGDKKWVDWYFGTFSQDPALGFTYTQMGQENSFTWARFGNAFEMQAKKLAELRKEGSIRLENLEETGVWFSHQYKHTPATAQSAMSDYSANNNRTVWFNSRYYRTNLVWEKDRMKIRDIHLFNENYASHYVKDRCSTPNFQYLTLPLVDGNLWSAADCLAALRLYQKEGSALKELQGAQPVIKNQGKNLVVNWPLQDGRNAIEMKFTESDITIRGPKGIEWCMELRSQPEAELPFTTIQKQLISAEQEGFLYSCKVKKGMCSDLRGQKNGSILRIDPTGNCIQLSLKSQNCSR